MYLDLIFFAITAYVVLMVGFMVADAIVGAHKGRWERSMVPGTFVCSH